MSHPSLTITQMNTLMESNRAALDAEFARLTKHLSPLEQFETAADLMALAHRLKLHAIREFYAARPSRPRQALQIPSGGCLLRN